MVVRWPVHHRVFENGFPGGICERKGAQRSRKAGPFGRPRIHGSRFHEFSDAPEVRCAAIVQLATGTVTEGVLVVVVDVLEPGLVREEASEVMHVAIPCGGKLAVEIVDEFRVEKQNFGHSISK